MFFVRLPSFVRWHRVHEWHNFVRHPIPQVISSTRYQDKKSKWQDGWSEKGKQLRHLFKTLQIVDIMERPDIMEQYNLKDGDDIGDLLIACTIEPRCFEIKLKEL